MVRTIARKELTELLRQRGALAIIVCVGLLLLLSAVPGIRTHARSEEWKTRASARVREQWLTQGERHPHSAAHYGVYAFRPLPSVSLLDPGVSAFIGQILPLETHQRSFPTYPPDEDTTSAARFGGLSPAALALIVLPLLVILAGYRTISGEREDGNLTTLLASGVSPQTLVAGKALALLAIAAALLGLKSGLFALALAATGAPISIERLLGLDLVHAAYVLVWVFLTIAVSAGAKSSQSGLSILLALWTVNSFVLPRVAASVGRVVVVEPSTEEFRAAIQRDITYRPDGTPWVNEWSKQLISKTLEKYGAQRIEDLPIGYAGIMLKGSDAHYEEVFEKHFARLDGLHRRQEAWHHLLSLAGPMIAARSLGQAFAATDLSQAQHFGDAAERYRRMFVEATNQAIETAGKGTGWELRMGRDYWESIPAFSYTPPSPWWALRSHAVSLAVITGWLAVALVFVARSHTAVRGL